MADYEKRYDLCISKDGKDKDGKDKTYYTKVGAGFLRNNVISLIIDNNLAIGGKAVLFEAKKKG